MFFSSFEHDAALEEVDWRDWIATPTQCVFGLFDGETLVGITAAYTHRDDPDGHTALLGTSYVRPAYRGRGLARLLYETRLAWIRARGTFHRVVVSHRRSIERVLCNLLRNAIHHGRRNPVEVHVHDGPRGRVEEVDGGPFQRALR